MMENTSDKIDPVAALPPLRDIIRDHGLRAEKSLGQNFLLDLNLTRKIARSARSLKDTLVIEIGPGPGGLTRALLIEGAAKVIAIEYDFRAVAALEPLVAAAAGRLVVMQQDALDADVSALATDAGYESPAIVANLPYNIATPLLTGWLARIHENPDAFQEMVLMFQKEVAQRIVAKPSSKAYGRLSVLSQWLCETKILFDVPPSAFVPPPKIVSSIVRLVPRARSLPPGGFPVMEKLTAAAFGQRRKMIRSSLKEYMQFVELCGIDPQLRAEDVSPEDYARLADAVLKQIAP